MRDYGFYHVLVLLIAAGLLSGCGKSDRPDASVPPTDSSHDSGILVAESDQTELQDGEGHEDADVIAPSEEELMLINRVRPQVEAFCGDCHVMPRPTSSSREDWVEEVEQGFMLYRTSGRTDLKEPPEDDVLKFFQYQAPETVSLPTSIRNYPPSPVPWRTQGAGLPGGRPPGVTNVQWMDIGLNDSPALVYCNIGTGAVSAHWPESDAGQSARPSVRLATLMQPVRAEPCDLDADGWIDLVVADIGEFNANDSEYGRVVWLRRKPDTEKFETIVLQENLSRVADVRPGDFDGDGDLDLLVAIFGWRKSGRTVLLQNEGADEDGRPRFELREIDERHGPIHVPPVDLNGDGHLDFVALISQDHEVVEAFINDGTGSFVKEVIWSAPDPAYGSSGIELVDLDQDGDLDVLFTNGDSFDRGPKPFHSVQWLENKGAYPFTHHSLCLMPGVLTAKAGDFDGDGDNDIIAASLLEAKINRELQSIDTSSVVLLIQREPGVFEPTQIEGRTHQHLSLATGDFDKNGKLDFAVGNFLRAGGGDQPDLVIWWNERPD